MKEFTEVLKDSFVDYAGKTHHFVIAALCQTPDNEDLNAIMDDDEEFCLEDMADRTVTLGVSICNPLDEFDEKTGTLKAIGRAKQNDPALFAYNRGYISVELIRAFLKQEAEYLKRHPDVYIVSYNEAKERYLKNKEMQELKNNFSDVEKAVVENVEKDPRFLDNVNKYLVYMKNQKQGCKKSIK